MTTATPTTETESESLFRIPFSLSQRTRHRILYGYAIFVLVFVLLPVVYVFPVGTAKLGAITQEIYVNGLINSFKLGLLIALVTTVFATIAAHFYRFVDHKNSYLVFMSLPLFVPGDTHAIIVAVFAKEVGLRLDFWTLAAAHVFYTYPYAFLMILATMASLPENVVSAAQDLGATSFRAFWDVELPIIIDGVISGFLVTFLLSINEAPRASVLGGRFDTISGLILSQYESIGLTQQLFSINLYLVVFAIVTICVILSVVLLR